MGVVLWARYPCAENTAVHGQENMAHVRQSRPHPGLGFQVNVLKNLQVVPSLLASVTGCTCRFQTLHHPRGNPRANLKSIPHRCYFRVVASEWEWTEETIYLPLGCLQGGFELKVLRDLSIKLADSTVQAAAERRVNSLKRF